MSNGDASVTSWLLNWYRRGQDSWGSRYSGKLFFQGPESQGRVADIEDFFAVRQAAQAIPEILRLVTPLHLFEIAGSEADRLHLSRLMAGPGQ